MRRMQHEERDRQALRDLGLTVLLVAGVVVVLALFVFAEVRSGEFGGDTPAVESEG